jgi:hypothetical protein
MLPFKIEGRAVMSRFTMIAAMQHYAGKVRTIRNEIRTERLLNSLSPQIRADIGWPDRYGRRRGYSD